MDQDKMSNLYRGPSIDASYQVSVHLAEGFQRRLKCEKLTDDGRQVMAKAKNYSLILLILVSIFIFSFYHTTATHFRLYYAMGL
jgi:hypothetical protein